MAEDPQASAGLQEPHLQPPRVHAADGHARAPGRPLPAHQEPVCLDPEQRRRSLQGTPTPPPATYERRSLIVTSNLEFQEWGSLFDSPATAAAVLARPLQQAHVITLKGESYRMRSRLAPPKANSSPPDDPAATRPTGGGQGEGGTPA